MRKINLIYFSLKMILLFMPVLLMLAMHADYRIIGLSGLSILWAVMAVEAIINYEDSIKSFQYKLSRIPGKKRKSR